MRLEPKKSLVNDFSVSSLISLILSGLDPIALADRNVSGELLIGSLEIGGMEVRLRQFRADEGECLCC